MMKFYALFCVILFSLVLVGNLFSQTQNTDNQDVVTSVEILKKTSDKKPSSVIQELKTGKSVLINTELLYKDINPNQTEIEILKQKISMLENYKSDKNSKVNDDKELEKSRILETDKKIDELKVKLKSYRN